MKVLLAFLGTTGLVVPSSITLISSIMEKDFLSLKDINFYKGNLEKVKKNLKDYNSGHIILTSKEIIDLTKEISLNIYRIFNETEYSEFMNDVYMFLNKAKNNLANKYIEEFNYNKSVIEKNNIDWRYQQNLSSIKLQKNLKIQISNEKYLASKLFYANNQYMSDKLSKDMNDYQKYRKEISRLNERVAHQKSNIEWMEAYFKHYENMHAWSKKVNSIYQNLADELEEMYEEFVEMWDGTIGSPEAFAKHCASLWKEIAQAVIGEVMSKYGATRSEITDYELEFQEQYKEFAVNLDLKNYKSPKWLESNEGMTLSYEELKERSLVQIEKEIKEQNIMNFAESRILIFNIVCKTLNSIYAINQVLFGNLFEMAHEIETFANKRIPQMFTDIQSAYKENGIKWTSKIEEDIENNLKIFSEIMIDFIHLIDPSSIASGLADVIFNTFTAIEDWMTTITVHKDIPKTIKVISDFGKQLSKIDPSFEKEYQERIKEYEQLSKDYKITKNRIDELNKILEDSKLDKIQENLKEWNKFFKKYDQYLDIEVINLNTKVSISSEKYLKKQLNVYLNQAMQTQFTYKLIWNQINIKHNNNLTQEELDWNYDNLIKLDTINKFIIEVLGGL